ncbi:MAG: hypothetical protein R2882_01635 [Gemmatimonadales bacterium]
MVTIAAGLFLRAGPLFAQPAGPVVPGERVRVVSHGARPVVGTLIAAYGTGWRIRRPGAPDTLVYPDSLHRFQRSAGRKGHGLLGAAVPVALSAALFLVCPHPQGGDDRVPTGCETASVLLALEGPFIGLIVGANVRDRAVGFSVAEGPERERSRVGIGFEVVRATA